MSEHDHPSDETTAVSRGPAVDRGATTLAHGPDWAGERALARGEAIDRYVVLSCVGSGGMGVVYAAYDPELDRKVALKLLRRPGPPDSAASRRLLREAQALARLSHPNVVGIHDVGVHEGRVWLAMEFVSGLTLREWLAQQERRWPEILDVIVRAGHGVAAAHAAGLCHRDLKPDNVMVGDDGRVRVMDFGLARGAAPSLDSEGMPPDSRHVDATVTDAGSFVGTPAYAAPERFTGYESDPRSDQFSLCVTLWEALYGERPFAGRTMAALEVAMVQQRPRIPAGASRIPAWLRDACVRGLAPDPEQRWPSMDALLAVLGRDRSRRGRRGAVVGMGVVGLSAALGAWWITATPRPCTGARDHLVDVWDSARREEILAAMLATGAVHADTVWTWMAAELDRYTDAWVAMHTASCEATTIRGEQSAELLDLRMGCLERARLDLRAVTERLTEIDETQLGRVHELADGLPPLSRCADATALQAEVEPPSSDEAPAVLRIRSELARARVARDVAMFQVAQERLEEIDRQLEAVTYQPVRTEVLLERGRLLVAQGRYDDAEAELRHAVASAGRLRQWDELREGLRALIHVIGHHQQRVDEALGHRELAEALAADDPRAEAALAGTLAAVWTRQGRLDRAEQARRRALALDQERYGSEHPRIAEHHLGLGTTLVGQGRYEEAAAELERALALYERALGSVHPSVANVRYELATVSFQRGDYPAAEAEYREVAALEERLLGPEHPHLASALDGLSAALFQQGEYARAEAPARRALEIRLRALGPDHAMTAASHNTLANLLDVQGRHAEAEAQFRRALAIWEQGLDPQHRNVAIARTNLALTLAELGREDEALVQARRGLEAFEHSLGADHPSTAHARGNLGRLLLARGELDDAQRQLRKSLETWEALFDAEHPLVARARINLGRALLMRGDAAQARPLLEAGLQRLSRQDDTPPEDHADAAFLLARAQWSTDRARASRERVLALIDEARASFGRAGPRYADALDELETWARAQGLAGSRDR